MNMICRDCPRRCGAERGEKRPGGVCMSPALPVVARAAPHYGEEPCISGSRGSGTVFFTGCNLKCVFCQNREISRGRGGKAVTVPELRDILLRLRDQGVHNINLVTPSHFIRPIAEALSGLELGIPVVWNSSGYESVESLKMLEGLVQIYMPDFKYAKPDLAKRYSAAEDYPEVARAAIKEMFRQTGPYRMENGQLRSGVLIRHLVLPGELENTKAVIDWVAETFRPGEVLFSLMSQYTPQPGAVGKLARKVTKAEYRAAERYMADCGIADGFTQERTSAKEEYTPDFHLQGI